MTNPQSICVVIAAKDASSTIERSVRSALAEPEVTEVVVVDDGSSDATGAAAMAAEDGTNRLRVERFDVNRGPAAARNHAIAVSSAPLLAVLDADDFFLPGRFTTLLALPGWDFVADNIVFIDESRADMPDLTVTEFLPASRLIDLEGFIEGNISKRGHSRGEAGFLKPVMRRDFLVENALHYNEDLRLGEDYDLYVRALAKGARYRVSHACGYGAVVRQNSLSGRHDTRDLKRLFEADRAILRSGSLPADAARLIRTHERHIRARYELRHFLDLKNHEGPGVAIRYVLSNPAAMPAIVGGIVADKTERFRRPSAEPVTGHFDRSGFRYLLAATPVPVQK